MYRIFFLFVCFNAYNPVDWAANTWRNLLHLHACMTDRGVPFTFRGNNNHCHMHLHSPLNMATYPAFTLARCKCTDHYGSVLSGGLENLCLPSSQYLSLPLLELKDSWENSGCSFGARYFSCLGYPRCQSFFCSSPSQATSIISL